MKMSNLEMKPDDEIDFEPDKMKRLPRGSFLAKPGDATDPRKTKVRVTLYLDSDIVAYFKQRAAQPNAAPYQTQINNELRTVMEGELSATAEYASLLENPIFIAAVAEKVQEYQAQTG
jgi:uncharacterized protein (DUF4415 family)